jgi:hypothetical protein
MKEKFKMKKAYAALLAAGLLVPVACKDFLDVNTNPNAPETVTPSAYLPPLLHWVAASPLFDGRYEGQYTQEWVPANGQTSLSNWERMGYDRGSDNGGTHWRTVYWAHGQNLVDLLAKAEAEQRWDILGVGQVIRAWDWMNLTDIHGEVILKQAFEVLGSNFQYDSQQDAYTETFRLLNEAIKNLQRTDGAVNAAYLAKGDVIYNGDRTKWLKFAYGLQAIALNHFSNKSTYKPADVIAAVDKSFASNSDDPLLQFPATAVDDANPLGTVQGLYPNYRQTVFVVNLMNGTVFGTPDPRMSRMLSPSPDSAYRGVDVNVAGYGALTASQQPMNLWGFVGTAGTAASRTRYLFDNKSKVPASISYAQLQFVKAEAAYKMGDKATALAAYKQGISSHIDFVNARNLDAGQTATQISSAEKAAFLASPDIVPTAAGLTLTHIMSQKYIAQWGWAHNELWTDMRRYHYTDVDPASGKQVYPGFAIPTNLDADNLGKVAYRIRPRFNSEYVWNRVGLDAIGGLAPDYHTKPTWIINP